MQWAAAHEDREASARWRTTRGAALPGARAATEPYLALFDAIVERQARLIARWQLVGFIHGVMNTDNMALSGETIDYGPCAFMDAYDPATVFSSIDHGGRYAYGNQPPIAQWNLARLAEAMLPLFDGDADRAIERATACSTGSRTCSSSTGGRDAAKLGLFTAEKPATRRSSTNCSRGCTRDRPTSRTRSGLDHRTPAEDAAADPDSRRGIAGWRRA